MFFLSLRHTFKIRCKHRFLLKLHGLQKKYQDKNKMFGKYESQSFPKHIPSNENCEYLNIFLVNLPVNLEKTQMFIKSSLKIKSKKWLDRFQVNITSNSNLFSEI